MMPFDITGQDFSVILFLIFLEGILSIDNALVLALLARDLPRDQQRKALTYGLIGAVVFRFISLFLVAHLMKWTWVKFVGGGYLVFVGAKHFLSRKGPEEGHPDFKGKKAVASFWKVVIMIELTDIAFAVDSILAAVAVTTKFWVVFLGGVLGIVLMRFAASVFLKILDRFPKLETTAYLLVLTIGSKLILDGFHFPGLDFHSSSSPAFWGFWSTMAGCIAYGFIASKFSARKAH